MKTTKIPYDYQQECIQAVLGHFAAGNRRAMYVMATGLGKTFVLAHILRELFVIGTTERACVALDKGTPLVQIRDELLEVLGELGITINVVTPNSMPEEWDCDIVITTLQLLYSRRKKLPRDMFDLLAVDEAHHSQARTYRAAIEHFDCDWLAFTGTPERSDGLDITEMFGEPVYDLQLEEAIRRKLGADMKYVVYTDNIDMRQLRAFAKRVQAGDRTITRRKLNDTLFLPTLYEKVVEIVRARSEKLQKTIIFCNSRAHVDETLKHFDGAKPFHSQISQGERGETLQAFRDGDLEEVVAINMFNEAVDFPEVQHLVLLRSTDSMTLWKQQIGRGYRGRGKKVVIHDFVANLERILAVRELGLAITRRGTSEGYEKPEALVIDGFAVEFSAEVVELLDLLGRMRTEFYPTYTEASCAAQKMDIRSNVVYGKKYRKDPRLPSRPDEVYPREWVNWELFLGTDSYLTYSEAASAARVLGCRKISEYQKKCSADKRLRTDPAEVYKDKGWAGWGDYLGTGRKQRRKASKLGFYSTYKEALEAARKLGFRKCLEYQEGYTADDRLPSTPKKQYPKDWVDWDTFLGTSFYTYLEACAVVRRLGVTAAKRYPKQGYANDPRLPRHPESVYFGDGWVDWPTFLGTVGEPRRRRKKTTTAG